MEKQISCKDMLMSNGGLNLIHRWPIQKRSENGSKIIPREDEEFSPNEESDQQSKDNSNEDDCFGINLDDD
ncbi:hypothetical protein PIB30_103414 [Stylosanthes scabra]|uniref:Uncharacterized protein n=1 Tax=Stylosanthes scabra TaxID=79078 RepID=A0ABU6YYN5_9FABA|nr:hypothetical protein [Stylosanthes scabra]